MVDWIAPTSVLIASLGVLIAALTYIRNSIPMVAVYLDVSEDQALYLLHRELR